MSKRAIVSLFSNRFSSPSALLLASVRTKCSSCASGLDKFMGTPFVKGEVVEGQSCHGSGFPPHDSRSESHSNTIAASNSASLTSLSNRALAHSASVCLVLSMHQLCNGRHLKVILKVGVPS